MYGEEIYEQYHRAVQSGALSDFLASTNMEDVRQHNMYLPRLTPSCGSVVGKVLLFGG